MLGESLSAYPYGLTAWDMVGFSPCQVASSAWSGAYAQGLTWKTTIENHGLYDL